jgi:SAM-dependent methyltransferase
VKLLEELVGECRLTDGVLSDPREGAVRRVTVRPIELREGFRYQLTFHEASRATSENLEPAEAERRLRDLLGPVFRQGLLRTADDEYQVLAARGEPKVLRRPGGKPADTAHDRPKRRVLEEGVPNPFLIELGVMDRTGKVRARRYGKFRQLNRFLELVDDVAGELPRDRPVQVVDFGSGKAYLTFALYQHLRDGLGLDVDVLGLDLKEDVVAACSALAGRLGYEHLRFEAADIAGYGGLDRVDLVLALHACDTATDAALAQAVRWDARVILAVPCCQKELMRQIRPDAFPALTEHGLLKERLCALATDALRAKLLELVGYRVQVVEFVDLEHTAKNVLIRATTKSPRRFRQADVDAYLQLRDALGADPWLERALKDRLPSELGRAGPPGEIA